MSGESTPRVYRFADRNGEQYQAAYSRDARWGWHVWTVEDNNGVGAIYTSFVDSERDLESEEIADSARGWTVALAVEVHPELLEPAACTDENGRPMFNVYLAQLAA